MRMDFESGESESDVAHNDEGGGEYKGLMSKTSNKRRFFKFLLIGSSVVVLILIVLLAVF